MGRQLTENRMRIGVCGSGYWGRTVHLPALAANPAVDLVGVWGRREEQSRAVADEFGIAAFADFRSMLDEVDAISFALPPEVQGQMALEAATTGKHLLLEKPIATTLVEADALVEAVERYRVSAAVFLTRLFIDDANELIARARAGGHTRCEVNWGSRALLPGTPFTNSVWRNGENGTLWDLGPHVLTILIQSLGRVVQVEASRPRKAKFQCLFIHSGGGESTVTLDQMDTTLERGSFERYVFSGGTGEETGGPFKFEMAECYQSAVRSLVDGAGRTDRAVSPGLRLGRDIVAVLEAACASIDSGGERVAVREN
jgi:hypothetical protein